MSYIADVRKITNIIDEEFDSRLANMLSVFMAERGFESCRGITDDEISEIKGNAMFGTEVMQAMLRTARRVARESTVSTFFKFIQYELNPCMAQAYDIWREDYSDETWQEICAELDESEEVVSIEGYFLKSEE